MLRAYFTELLYLSPADGFLHICDSRGLKKITLSVLEVSIVVKAIVGHKKNPETSLVIKLSKNFSLESHHCELEGQKFSLGENGFFFFVKYLLHCLPFLIGYDLEAIPFSRALSLLAKHFADKKSAANSIVSFLDNVEKGHISFKFFEEFLGDVYIIAENNFSAFSKFLIFYQRILKDCYKLEFYLRNN